MCLFVTQSVAVNDCVLLFSELDRQAWQRIGGWAPAHQRILPSLFLVESDSPVVYLKCARLHCVFGRHEDSSCAILDLLDRMSWNLLDRFLKMEYTFISIRITNRYICCRIRDALSCLPQARLFLYREFSWPGWACHCQLNDYRARNSNMLYEISNTTIMQNRTCFFIWYIMFAYRTGMNRNFEIGLHRNDMTENPYRIFSPLKY